MYKMLSAVVILLGVIGAPAAAETAMICGRIMPPGKCTAIAAVSRDMGLDCPGEIDLNTGKFTIKNLVDGPYDLMLTTKDGIIEGVDLRVPLGMESDEPLTDEDKGKVSKWISDNFELGKEFENKGRAIYLDGNDRCCMALVEKIRDRPFHASKGDATWRVEIWIFDKVYGTWRKRQRAALTLRRKRMPLSEFEKMVYVFDPKLGGIDIKNGKDVSSFEYELPRKLGPEMGKTAQ